MTERANAAESVKRYVSRNRGGAVKKITVIILREPVNESRTISELYMGVASVASKKRHRP
jgi:hypothetical protein